MSGLADDNLERTPHDVRFLGRLGSAGVSTRYPEELGKALADYLPAVVQEYVGDRRCLGASVSDHDCRSTVRMTITEAKPHDAAVVARLFLAAFHNSARVMFGERPFRPDAMADFYSFIIRTEPGCTLIAWTSSADRGEKAAGYITASRDMQRVWSRLLVSGAWLPWLWRYFTGRYGLARGAGPRLLRTQRAFAESARAPDSPRASVLSLGVEPSSQGQGVGRALLRAGLDYLRRNGVAKVKLEVLADNHPARRLYESEGFRDSGMVPVGAGSWVVMVKDIEPQPTLRPPSGPPGQAEPRRASGDL